MKKKGALRRGDKVWRRAGEELITRRQVGEQQTDATRARLSSAQPGRRETDGRIDEWEKESRRGYCHGAKCNERCEKVRVVKKKEVKNEINGERKSKLLHKKWKLSSCFIL